MANIIQGQLEAKGKKFGLIVSRFNEFITQRLLDGALDCIYRHGGSDADVEIVWVPGSFEIPVIAKRMSKNNKYNAIICLAAVIQGGTPHFQYVASEVTKGIAQVALDSDIPTIYGVLTCDNLDQAVERAGTKQGNKGWQAAQAAIEMADLMGKI
ncbi:6,7-dimethyl-8-ribityllumazine synthase [bacterium]